jgi:hypothetical protein
VIDDPFESGAEAVPAESGADLAGTTGFGFEGFGFSGRPAGSTPPVTVLGFGVGCWAP